MRWRGGGVDLYCGDCLAVLPTLPDNSVDLVLTDPPYYKVKKDAWDRQWKTPGEYLTWLDRVLKQFARVLRPNGSLYLFASPEMAARVECLVAQRFEVLNSIVWNKLSDYAAGDKRATAYKARDHESFRRFFDYSERIIFAEHRGADNIAKGEAGYEAKCDELRGFIFEPLRSWMRQAMLSAGLCPRDLNRAVGSALSGGGMASHYVGKTGQWELPTPQHYEAIQQLAPHVFNRQYDDLRRQYDDLRRPFQVTADVPYTDVWDFPTVAHYPGKHPCEKPQALLRHVIAASSRPGAVVLDAFFGSGAVGEAATSLGRSCIAVEMSPEWCDRATARLKLEKVE